MFEVHVFYLFLIDTEPTLRDDACLREKAIQPMVRHFQIPQNVIEDSIRVGLAYK